MSIKLTPKGIKALDDVVRNTAESKRVPAFAYGVTTADEEVYFNAAGPRLVTNPSGPQINKDDVFWLCSMTKMITHLAALHLIDQGKLSPETPVEEFFPQFAKTVIIDDVSAATPTYKPGTSKMLVKHLQHFTSGLFYGSRGDYGTRLDSPYSAPHNLVDPHTTWIEVLKGGLPGIPLKFEPGSDWTYGYSSDVLGFIVEKISGKTLEAYFQDVIFTPLGIKGSFYLTPYLEEKLLPLSVRTPEGLLEPWTDQPYVGLMERDPAKISCHLGGVGVYMPLRDYLKLLRHILQIKAGTATNPIWSVASIDSIFISVLSDKSASSVNQFTALPYPGLSWSTAAAVATKDWEGRRKKGSIFWTGWAGTTHWIDPSAGVAGVMGTQLTCGTGGSRDPAVRRAQAEFEEALYAQLT
ncbi:hypothetical protein D9619_009687 [Psilocybe cf. subviscida]|uniref:Beta-lactamase-related domain-containing protein n=1 Tax=Psilocybe cf. subviscida TaxID=2480587 RepID=A0A8H5BNA8_9AGAR|nr:hypothetical protein D9619_009687 [Psilocybe cf. subviscida]